MNYELGVIGLTPACLGATSLPPAKPVNQKSDGTPSTCQAVVGG